jgi:hypothetical protein
MDVANKESVHPGGETVKWDETIESLRGRLVKRMMLLTARIISEMNG